MPLLHIFLGISNKIKKHFNIFFSRKTRNIKWEWNRSNEQQNFSWNWLQTFEYKFHELKNKHVESKNARITFSKNHKSKLSDAKKDTKKSLTN